MIEHDNLVLLTLGILVFFLFLLENHGNRVGYSSLYHKLDLDYRNHINVLLALYKANCGFLRCILHRKATVDMISNAKWGDRIAYTVKHEPAVNRLL